MYGYRTAPFDEQYARPQGYTMSSGTGADSNPWSIYFTDPTPPTRQPLSEFKTSLWTMPEAYRGRSAVLRESMEQLLITEDRFQIQVLMPLERTEQLSFTWSSMEFLPQYVPQLPERVAPRTMEQRRTHGAASIKRHGIGILMGMPFLSTELGQQSYRQQLIAMNNSLAETMCWDVINVLMNAGQQSFQYAQEGGFIGPNEVDALIRFEKMFFDVFKSKSAIAWEVVDTEIKRIMATYQNTQSQPDVFVTGADVQNFISHVPRQRIAYYEAGPAGPLRLEQGADGVSTIRNTPIFLVHPLTISPSLPSSQEQMTYGRQIGMHHLFFDPHRGSGIAFYGQSGTNRYLSRNTSVQFLDMDNDTMGTFPLSKCVANHGRTDPVTGEFISRMNDTMFTFTAQMSQEDMDADPFHFRRRDGRVVPVKYIGNMDPGDGTDRNPGVFNHTDYADLAASTLPHFADISKDPNDLLAQWTVVEDALKIINSYGFGPAEQAWAQAISSSISADNVENHPGFPGEGVRPLVNLPEAFPNPFGSIDFPPAPTGAQSPPWAGQLLLPPFMGTWPGLRTIAQYYRTNNNTAYPGFSTEWFGKVAAAVDFVEKFVAKMQTLAPGSEFLNPANVSSWFHRPDAATALFENLSYRHPLFFRAGGATRTQAQIGAPLVSTDPSGQITGAGGQLAGVEGELLRMGAPGEKYVALRFGEGSGDGKGKGKSESFTEEADAYIKAAGGEGDEPGRPSAALLQSYQATLNNLKGVISKYVPSKTPITDAATAASKGKGSRETNAIMQLELFKAIDRALRRAIVVTILSSVDIRADDDPTFARRFVNLKNVLNFLARFGVNGAGSGDRGYIDLDTFRIEDFMSAFRDFALTTDGVSAFKAAPVRGKRDPTGEERANVILRSLQTLVGKASDLKGSLPELLVNAQFGDYAQKVAQKDAGSIGEVWIRTPLVYTPRQYYEIGLFAAEAENEGGQLFVMPSDHDNSEEIATLDRMFEMRKLLDPGHPEYRGERAASMLPSSLSRAVFDGTNTPHYSTANFARASAQSTQPPLVTFPETTQLQSSFIGASAEVRQSSYIRPAGESLGGLRSRTDGAPSGVKRGRSRFVSDDGESSAIAAMERDARRKVLSDTTAGAMGAEYLNNTSGNFERALQLIWKKLTFGLLKVIAQIFAATPLTQQFLELTVDQNLAHPVNYILARPHIRLDALSLLKVGRGGKTGKTYYGHEMLTIGEDAVTQMHFLAWNMYYAPVVTNDRCLFRIDGVYVNGYYGGGGMLPYTHEAYQPLDDRYGKGSVFVLMVPKTMTEVNSLISMTGHVEFSGFQKDALSYPSAYFYNRKWGFKKHGMHGNITDWGLYQDRMYNSIRPRPNYVCLRGLTLYYNHISGTHNLYRPGDCHWPDKFIGPGVMPAISGKEYSEFKEFQRDSFGTV